MLAWNGGAHVNPTFAGDTIYAWSEVLEKAELTGRTDAGALRIRLSACKNVDPLAEPFDSRNDKGEADPRLVLELDCWLAVARAAQNVPRT